MNNNQSQNKCFGHLIQEGLHGQISLIGFPYSVGMQRDNLYRGQENGPDCLRRFLNKIGHLINPEYEISIADLTISDYGNIQISDQKSFNYEELIQKLMLKIKSVINKDNIPVIIGGSKDCSYAASAPILELEGKNAVISISSFLDTNPPYDGDKLSVTSCMRKLIEDWIQNKQSQVIFFATQSQLCSQQQMSFIQNLKENAKIVPLNEIRRADQKHSDSILEPSTQASQKFQQILNSMSDFQNIHISFSLESIHSSYCLGVTRMSSIAGLTGEEAIEIMFVAGQCKNVKGIDFTDFNPSNEDFRTGMLLGNLLYYFTMGYSQRLKK